MRKLQDFMVPVGGIVVWSQKLPLRCLISVGFLCPESSPCEVRCSSAQTHPWCSWSSDRSDRTGCSPSGLGYAPGFGDNRNIRDSSKTKLLLQFKRKLNTNVFQIPRKTISYVKRWWNVLQAVATEFRLVSHLARSNGRKTHCNPLSVPDFWCPT